MTNNKSLEFILNNETYQVRLLKDISTTRPYWRIDYKEKKLYVINTTNQTLITLYKRLAIILYHEPYNNI